MKEVKRPAKVGEKIKVTREHNGGWQGTPYPLGSVWTVRRQIPTDSKKPNDFSKGLVACEGNQFCKFAEDYVVLVPETNETK